MAVFLNLFDEVNARLEVEAKVDELPIDAFLAVLLLLEHEHVVVEELLEPLVGVVDAQLLKGVQLKWVFGEEIEKRVLMHADK